MEQQLNQIFFNGEPEINAELERWRLAIIASRRWSVGGPGLEYDDGPDGHSLHGKGGNPTSARHAVVLEPGISGKPGPDELGTGPIMLRTRDAEGNLEDDEEGVLWINFTDPIEAGTHITVVPDGSDWTIPGADCPADEITPPPEP